MMKCLYWDPDGISHLETLGCFAFSLQIPIVYSTARGRVETTAYRCIKLWSTYF